MYCLMVSVEGVPLFAGLFFYAQYLETNKPVNLTLFSPDILWGSC